jgi:hypothetical protein
MRRHDLDPFSLAFGVLFALVGLLFLVVQVEPSGLHPARLWPVPVIAVGATILALAVRATLARPGRDPDANEIPIDDGTEGPE